MFELYSKYWENISKWAGDSGWFSNKCSNLDQSRDLLALALFWLAKSDILLASFWKNVSVLKQQVTIVGIPFIIQFIVGTFFTLSDLGKLNEIKPPEYIKQTEVTPEMHRT